MSTVLKGVRVMIVEDEFFVAVRLEDALHELGYETTGPYTTLEVALGASRRETLDLAILDINLNGQLVYPLADELTQCEVPFMFLTGYSYVDLPAAYRSLPRLQKPFARATMKTMLEALLPR